MVDNVKFKEVRLWVVVLGDARVKGCDKVMKKINKIIMIFVLQWFVASVNGMFTRRLSQLQTASTMRRLHNQAIRPIASKTTTLQTQPSRSSWFSDKFAALKNTMHNYWYGSSAAAAQSALLKSMNPVMPESIVSTDKQTPLVATVIHEPSVLQAAAEGTLQEAVNELHPDIERIKVLLEADKPDMVVVFNLLSQMPTDIDQSEMDVLKQKFFDKINFDAEFFKFVTWLEKNSPKGLFTLLPNDPQVFADTIAVLLKKFDSKDMSYTEFWIYQGVYKSIETKPIDDLGAITLSLIQDADGRNLIKELMEQSFIASTRGEPILYQKFIKIINQYAHVFLKSPGNFPMLTQHLEGNKLLGMVFDIDSSCRQTPSYRHLERFHSKLSGLNKGSSGPTYAGPVFNDHNFQSNIIYKPLHKEKELIDLGYEVMYHARRWRYAFLSDIYSMLYSYKSGKQLKDFIFTHLDDPVLGNVSEDFYESEKKKRERLIKEGNLYDSKDNILGRANRASLLFLNKFLFGNLGKVGSCSMNYILENRNIGEIDFSIEELFAMFGRSDVYKEFESRLKELQEEHNRLTEYGELLQIAIPKNNVDKCVYYTTSGGPKREFVFARDDLMKEAEYTTDIKLILKDLDENPQNECEFVLVNTRDQFGGLNPDSGIKVFSYNAADPEKWAEFKQKEHDLFASIIEWMQQHGIQRKQAKMAQE
jgi:hypothetical protein